MSHHTADKICPLCQEKIMTCHLRLQLTWNLLKVEFPDAHISWGFRGEKDQNEMFRYGKSRATWPKSKHNVQSRGKPCSRAFDLFRMIGELAVFPPKFYYDVANWVESTGQPIDWSGKLVTSKDEFCETDHFQLTNDVI